MIHSSLKNGSEQFTNRVSQPLIQTTKSQARILFANQTSGLALWRIKI